MKKLALSALALAAVLASPVLAQQKAPEAGKSAAPAVAAEKKVVVPTGVFYKGQGPMQYLAKDRLIGAKVQNSQGQIIGDIEDLIIDRNSNEVQGVVMGTGGFLGAGEKKVGVRLSALKVESKDGKIIISLPQATKEVLGALAPYERSGPKKGIVEKATEKVKELSDKTKETAAPALEKAKEVGKAAVDKTKEVTKSAVDTAKDAAKPKQ